MTYEDFRSNVTDTCYTPLTKYATKTKEVLEVRGPQLEEKGAFKSQTIAVSSSSDHGCQIVH